MDRIKVAIIGSGNICTDLMIKVMRLSENLEMAAFVGIDPASDGLARAQRLKVPTTSDGVPGLMSMPHFGDSVNILDIHQDFADHIRNRRLCPAFTMTFTTTATKPRGVQFDENKHGDELPTDRKRKTPSGARGNQGVPGTSK